MRHRDDSPLVERNGMVYERLEILPRQLYRRRPENALAGVLRKPYIQSSNDVGIDLARRPSTVFSIVIAMRMVGTESDESWLLNFLISGPVGSRPF